MSDKKRLTSRYDYSDSEEEITPPSKIHDAPESSRRRNKRKATHLNYSAPSPKMIWSENDELSILKGIVEYRNERGVDYVSDSVAFCKYLKDGNHGMESSNFSKDQLLCKIRKLKAKFRDNSAKKNLSFNKSHDSEIFNLSMAIWGKEKADGNVTTTEGTAVENEEEARNGEPEDDDDSCDIKHMDKETTGVKENEVDNAEDEICALEDAFEATVFPHSSKYIERMLLRNLRNLRGQERKALSDEWKALLDEEMQLKSRKLLLAANLTTAAALE